MTKKKTVPFNSKSIDDLAKDKPVVYKIYNKKDVNIYTGSAKKGRVADRIKEHLPGAPDAIPGGTMVKIEQMDSIGKAQKSEQRIIKRSKPRHNKKGK